MNGREMKRPLEILLVEDNPGDILLTREALKEGNALCNLHVVKDGVEALGFLRRQSPHVAAPRPDLILLDLNLPRRDGRSVLAEVKTDEDLKSIPVVVLTTSEADEDIATSYNLHANCYIAKPGDLDRFFRVVRCIEDFWLDVVKLPPG
jgi:CheY-like chemotaxis protein